MTTNPSALQSIVDKMRPVLDLPNDGSLGRRAKRGQAKRRPDREGTAYVAAHLPADLVTRLRVAAAQDGKPMHELVSEALALLLAHRAGKASA